MSERERKELIENQSGTKMWTKELEVWNLLCEGV
jgi:hypothetical protein